MHILTGQWVNLAFLGFKCQTWHLQGSKCCDSPFLGRWRGQWLGCLKHCTWYFPKTRSSKMNKAHCIDELKAQISQSLNHNPFSVLEHVSYRSCHLSYQIPIAYPFSTTTTQYPSWYHVLLPNNIPIPNMTTGKLYGTTLHSIVSAHCR